MRSPRLGDMLSDWERAADSDDLIRPTGPAHPETLALFGVPADLRAAAKGPAVTQYLIKLGYGNGPWRRAQAPEDQGGQDCAPANDSVWFWPFPACASKRPSPAPITGVEVPNREK
ncbi:MAG: hypothetical protein R3A10_13945 [Caldilineaceae bacterium]